MADMKYTRQYLATEFRENPDGTMDIDLQDIYDVNNSWLMLSVQPQDIGLDPDLFCMEEVEQDLPFHVMVSFEYGLIPCDNPDIRKQAELNLLRKLREKYPNA